jgi:hypothetical protein
VAVAACAATYYIAKRHKKHQQGRLLGGKGGTRDISSMNDGGSVHPSLLPYLGLQENKGYLYNNESIPLPVAVTVGLGWDSEGANLNLDILGSVFNSRGQSMGYVQGSTVQTLFNGAISHSGDDTAGSSLSSVLGDNEHITIDFGMLPPDAATIVIGVLLVNGSGLNNCYVNVLPLLRQDSIDANTSTTVEYDSDSDDDASNNFRGQSVGYSPSQDNDGDDELILLYKAKLDQQHPNFPQSRGFIPLKFTRNPQNQSWQLVPIRQVTMIDNQYGLWPALERAVSSQSQSSPVLQQQQQYSPQPQYSQPQYQQGGYSQPQFQQGGYGSGFPPAFPPAPSFDQSSLFPPLGGYPPQQQQYGQPPYGQPPPSSSGYGSNYGGGYQY